MLQGRREIPLRSEEGRGERKEGMKKVKARWLLYTDTTGN
jgi:hypothetical protein